MTDFERAVYEAVKLIPEGYVATYGQIAELAGYPRAARAVGNALHKNPDETNVRCHRVVNSDGRLARNFGFGGPEEQRRRLMAEVLRSAGLEFEMPRGAFYFFPAAPGGDDTAFTDALLAERILAVPGRGFGFPGHIRLSCSVDERIIERSAAGFARAAGAAKR